MLEDESRAVEGSVVISGRLCGGFKTSEEARDGGRILAGLYAPCCIVSSRIR